ncbi:MAG TPA: PDZ domain-containing protein [Blastocatellia bacterium]|nr:PDZ domain-containing protein [Blastocatellia bacterium]
MMKRAAGLFAVVSLLVTGALGSQSLAQSGRAKVTPARGELTPGQNGGFLGVFLSDVSDARARELKLGEVRGAVVGQVVKDSPASAAGLQENDVILSYNNEQVQSAAQVHRLLTETPPGRTVTLGISRDGKPLTVQATLGERQGGTLGVIGGGADESELLKEQAEKWLKESAELRRQFDQSHDQKLLDKAEELKKQAEEFRKLAEDHLAEVEKFRSQGLIRGPLGSRGLLPSARPSYRLGVKVLPLSEQLGKYFNVPDRGGVLVTEVEPNSAGARAGLKAGDCIIEANGEKVHNASDLTRLISVAEGGDKKEAGEGTLKVVRDRKEQTLKIEAERR